jgi:hypothetical protein
MNKLFLIICSLCFCIYPQIQPVVPDFLVSGEENIPSAFHKYVPDIIFSDSVKFITCWNDMREGAARFYAQEFDHSGNKIGRNFKLPGEMISCNYNNYRLTLEFIYSNSLFGTAYNVYAVLYNPAGAKLAGHNIFSFTLPECGTGYIDGKINITSSDSAFYIYGNEGGGDYLAKITIDGTLSLLRYSDYSQITQITSAATRSSSHFYAWIKGLEDTIPVGLYASFYNNSDSLIKPLVQVAALEYVPDYWDYIGRFNLEAVTLNDSTYKLFWFNRTTKVLYSVLLNTKGDIISGTDSLIIAGNTEDVNMKVTNINNGQFTVYIQPVNFDTNEICFVQYNIKGERIGEVFTTDNLKYTHNLYYTGSGKYYFMSNDDCNICLEEYCGYITGTRQKVNDDEYGSNEVNYDLTAYGNDGAAATWSNENHTFIRIIHPDGTAGEIKTDPEDKNIRFFSNKKGVAGWIGIDENSYYYAGYTVYDEGLNIIDKKKIVENRTFLPGTAPQINIISDTEFIFSIDIETGVELYKISAAGTVIKNITLSFNTTYLNHYIYPDLNDFWIKRGQYFVKYTNDLESEDIGFETNNKPGLYLGNNRFLYLKYSYNPYTGTLFEVTGSIINEKSDTIKTILLSGNSNYSIAPVPGNRFMLISKSGKDYYVRTFNNNGDAFPDSCKISINPSAMQGISSLMNGDKLYFTWTDFIEEGRGFNVYGSIFNSDELVSVKQVSPQLPASFSLTQNYPNPFNPVTNIEFDAAEAGLVTIKVFDILGREVTTLVNEEKAPGRYKIEFNASALSSGTYFYRMNINNYTSVKKMTLLK